MAQTRRRRQTKHRGNAAGVVESRGRTGRAPTAAEKRGEVRAAGKGKRADRYDRPPTWRGSFWRGLAMAVAMVALAVLLTHKPGIAFGLFPFVLAIYTVVSFYTDQWMYRRRLRSKAREGKALPR
ncbi:MAG TPA: hypothetical protein VEJ23_03995 [Solirubrobacteraceae bacterium]|nr:hypothetical protein [Solirubrobacteraceae bacterium]